MVPMRVPVPDWNFRLEHGVYNLARVRDAATSRYTRFQIPWEWMKQDTGIVSQVTYIHSPWVGSTPCRDCTVGCTFSVE